MNYIFKNRSGANISADTIDILRLVRSENVGPSTFNSLIELYGSAKVALDNIEECSIKGGRSRPIKVCAKKNAEEEIERIIKFGGSLLSYIDPKYPTLLKQIYDYPPIITYKGNIELANTLKSVAIVGARNASANGKHFARQLASELTANGYNTVSGLARGIDTAVHQANISKTIAVIAGGIDNIYPPENEKLYKQISVEGLLISEQPFATKPLSSHFPMRNRIISGIASCTAVIEAGLKSGSLITAGYALEQNRDLYAMPNFPLDPRSKGSNQLIRDGAIILESAEDIIKNTQTDDSFKKLLAESATNDNNFRSQNTYKKVNINDNDRKLVFELLSATPISYDTLVSETNLSLPEIYTICLEYELAGKITRHHGNKVSLKYSDIE